MTEHQRRQIRFNWRTAVLWLIGLGLVVALVWTWFLADIQRQDRFIRTVIVLFSAFSLFLLWVLFASRWKLRMRLVLFFGTVAIILFCRFALRISGVTGDMLPIVDWRWKQPRAARTDTPGARAAATATLTNAYPQFLGPTRDGVLPGPQLARDWMQSPPRELWRHAVGAAWSGFAVSGSHAITQEQQGENELVVCYDALTGAKLWSHSDTARYATTIAGEGPRATPTISSNRVYTMGGTGILNCLDLTTGKVVWTTNTLAEHNAEMPTWGVACSPLVTESAVIVSVGGAGHTLVAYGRETGMKLWASGNDEAHWSSPARAVIAGVPQIILFSENVAGYDEQSGKVLWQSPWRSTQPRVAVPLVLSGDRVLVSQGYGGGSELLQITRTNDHWRATRVWKSIRLKSKFANMVLRGGFVYGLDDGALACIDASTGELKWKGDRYGHGQMILAGELLLIMAEKGDIVLVEPNPTEQRELTRFKVFTAKTWNPPALAGDLLFVRNDRQAACLRLPLAR